MKRVVSVIAAGFLILGCWACGGEKPKEAAPAPVEEKKAEGFNPYGTQLKVMNKAKDLKKKSDEMNAAHNKKMKELGF